MSQTGTRARPNASLSVSYRNPLHPLPATITTLSLATVDVLEQAPRLHYSFYITVHLLAHPISVASKLLGQSFRSRHSVSPTSTCIVHVELANPHREASAPAPADFDSISPCRHNLEENLLQPQNPVDRHISWPAIPVAGQDNIRFFPLSSDLHL